MGTPGGRAPNYCFCFQRTRPLLSLGRANRRLAVIDHQSSAKPFCGDVARKAIMWKQVFCGANIGWCLGLAPNS